MGHNKRIPSDNIVVKGCVYVLAIVILLAIAFLISLHTKKIEPVSVMQHTDVAEMEVDAEEPVVDPYTSPEFPISLGSVRFGFNEGELDFDFSLSSWTAYVVDFSNEHKTVDITLYNTNVAANSAEDKPVAESDSKDTEPQLTKVSSGLKVIGDMQSHDITINHYNHNQDTIMRIDFPYSVHLVKSKIMKGHPSSLFLNFKRTENPRIVNEPELINPEPAAPSVKEAKPYMDYNDSSEAIYDTAKNLLYFKKYDEAIAQLESNPMVTLENDKAAEMLTKTYIITHNYTKAQKLGSRSLELFPLNVEIRRLLAQVYFVQKDYEKSHEILKAANPPMKQHLDYYELLASVMLKVKEYAAASGIYRNMLAIDANKSDWWAGLGITLQAQGKINLALEAYNKALRINNMDSNLLGYVKEQISILQ